MHNSRTIDFQRMSLRPSRTVMLVTIAFAAVTTLPLMGCASSNPDTDEATATQGEPVQDQRAAGGSTTSETSSEATDQTPPAGNTPDSTDKQAGATNESLNDAQILGVVKVANEGEVATSQLAAQKAMTPEVRDYAHDMVQDHLVASQYVDQTTTTEPPGGSEMATTLIQESNVQLESLSAMSGADFDRAYVESQIEAHQDLLENIENDLLPQAESVAVRQLLESMRDKVGEHLAQARELQQQLASIAG